MNVSGLFRECIRDFFRRLTYSFSGFPKNTGDDLPHLEAVMAWLERTTHAGRGGVSSHYSLLKGKWLDPFPETTGYIIPTFYDYAEFSGENRFSDMARNLTDWLGRVQLEDGGCMQGSYSEERGKTGPVVFNTGQNLLGFLRAYQETKDERYLQSARRAGDFLVRSTDEKRIWNQNLLRGQKHTINSRTAWALLELHRVLPDPGYRSTAQANLEWVLGQQRENGWFEHGSSRSGGLPNTHFLSYTCEGLLQSYRLEGDARYLEAALRTTSQMRRIFVERGMLYAFWDANWKNHGRYLRWAPGRFICMTGNAQIATVWMWCFEETGGREYLESAIRMLDHIKALHDIRSKSDGLRGGVKGSFPVYGGYSTFKYPNWAAKFFADALMLKIRLQKRHMPETPA